MVEHDAECIRRADHLIDLGPTGGRGGGRVVAEGPPSYVLAHPASPTARALANEHRIATSRVCRGRGDAFIELSGARANNLRIDKLALPVGRMNVIAGVSGSGKSTLVQKVLYPAVRRVLGLASDDRRQYDKLVVPKSLERALLVDQSPIGRTPRSVPATFLGVWDEVRKLYASSNDAKVRGYGPSRFSFNSAQGGGRCPTCDGQGAISHEMSFLPDVTTPCEACGGSRFEAATGDVRYLGLSIERRPRPHRRRGRQASSSPTRRSKCPLQIMCDLGVGYLHLGQGSHTLSGGEAQRLKLAAELTAGRGHEPTCYVLDEPTTGLHLADVERLIAVLDRLVERGDTLVVIEHHPGVIARADHVIELGPEGGEAGGHVVAQGTPREVARKADATGIVLKELFAKGARGIWSAKRALAGRRRALELARGALPQHPRPPAEGPGLADRKKTRCPQNCFFLQIGARVTVPVELVFSACDAERSVLRFRGRKASRRSRSRRFLAPRHALQVSAVESIHHFPELVSGT